LYEQQNEKRAALAGSHRFINVTDSSRFSAQQRDHAGIAKQGLRFNHVLPMLQASVAN
jgi:hypothetical protein